MRAPSVGLLVVCLLASRSSLAQGPPNSDRNEPALCFGFSFLAWTPPLNWRTAGHAAVLDSSRVPRAPDGRGWAADDLGKGSDSTLVLFPTWWPAGIVIELERKPVARGDTVVGHAIAMVADGRVKPSTSRVRAWQTRCGPPR
jgi:hypothetical protein